MSTSAEIMLVLEDQLKEEGKDIPPSCRESWQLKSKETGKYLRKVNSYGWTKDAHLASKWNTKRQAGECFLQAPVGFVRETTFVLVRVLTITMPVSEEEADF